MTTWQRRLRLAIALGAVALALAVAFAFQRRAERRDNGVVRSDPKAIVETFGFEKTRHNRDKEEVLIRADVMRVYGDGTAKGERLTVTTVRSGGRTFVLQADRAEVGNDESSYVLDGNVRLTSSDGLTVESERASYVEAEGVIRSVGPTRFTRGRMSGSGTGFTYDKTRDQLRILRDVSIHTAPGAKGEGAQAPMSLTSSSMELDRVAHVARFEEAFRVTRGAEVIEAASGAAHLTEAEERVRLLELRGGSKITAAPGGVGSLESMAGRDLDLTYGADGETLEHVRIAGNGVIRVAAAGQASRQIAADSFEIPLGAGGTRPTALTARGRVELTMPAEKGAAARTITAETLDGKGDEASGLTSARFGGKVVYRERGPQGDRSAASELLEVALQPGLTAIDEATFLRPVEFVDGQMTARSPRGKYRLAAGVLDLTGADGGAPRPNVSDDRLSIDADAIEIVLEGPRVHARGAVRSAVRPAKAGGDARTPAMFKQDQPVSASADELRYDGSAEEATYSGSAQLFQADTTIKGTRITLNSRTGDLTAAGDPVATTAVLVQTGKDGRKQPSTANAKSQELQYQESERRVTYLGDAYVSGPQGELRAARVELYLKPSGDELERAEAYEGVSLTEPRQKITGDRLTYTSADERYVVGGRPLKIVDECDGVTEGRHLTYLKGSERVVVDGSEQIRTRTRGGARCP